MSTAPSASRNPFLQGALAPVSEEVDEMDLVVEGELPSALRGLFTRNGPNPQYAPKQDIYHPFDGDGMVHAIYFEDGGVRYRNRWIQSAGLLAERKRGHACYGSLSRFIPPEPDVVEEAGGMKNTANTQVVRHAGRYLALMEAAPPTELSRELETIGEFDFQGRLEGPMTAHPKLDPRTGEMLFFGYSPFPPFLRYHVADASGALVHSVAIDIPRSVMMHDFAFTEKHVLFLDSPAVFDANAMLQGEPAMRWEPEHGTRIGVLPRRGSAEEIRWFEIDDKYVVHFFNAWETSDDRGGRIEIHAPAFDRMPGGLQFDNPVQVDAPTPHHWTIDLAAGSVKAEQSDEHPGEFPRVNDDYAGCATRYLYNSIARGWDFDFDFHGVIKYDNETGTRRKITYPESVVSGEHIFAPDPGGAAEDDGYLMTLATDRITGKTELLVLDARDLESGPVARVLIPHRVPIGFHANWLPED